MKIPQQPHKEDARQERSDDRDVAPKAATRSASLGPSLRACLRQVTGAQMLQPDVVKKLETRASDAVEGRSPHSVPSLSGVISRMCGASRRHIALLRDVNLRTDHGDPALTSSKELRRAAQELRRSFNRMSFESKSDISTVDLAGLLKRLEERVGQTSTPQRELVPLTRTLTDATRVLGIRGPSIPWSEAREIVVRVLGAVRDVTSRHHSYADDSSQVGAVPQEALHQLEALLLVSSYSAHRATDITTTELPTLTDNRSVPHKFTAAARRSLCGTQLGFIQSLESAYAQFERAPGSDTLDAIASVIHSWDLGKRPHGGLISGTNTEPLTWELQRDAVRSPSLTMEGILAPIIEWSSTHYEHLPETSIGHLKTFISGAVSSMRNAAVMEMLRTPDTVTFQRGDTHATLESPHSSQKSGQPVGEGLLLRKRLGAFGLFGPTLRDVTQHFDCKANGATKQELDYLAQAARWATNLSQENVPPPLPTPTTAVWISEFDGGQGTTIPKEIGEHFIELQQKLVVSQNSTESGFVYPESEDWLRQHVHQHDGFLLVMQEGSLQGALKDQTSRALFVATCDQESPSPLMKKIEQHAASYIASLDGRCPRMVCELALSAPEATLFLRKYGEHAYGALDRQFRYNTISRFPTAERVDCFATCRTGSVAMNAHERMGWKKTGAIYVDEHGTHHDILHNAIYPAATLLGFQDIP